MPQRSTEILVFEAFPNEQVSVLMGSVTGLQSKNMQLDQAQKTISSLMISVELTQLNHNVLVTRGIASDLKQLSYNLKTLPYR